MGLPPAKAPTQIGRYAIHGVMSQGGMATVHYGRLIGPVGFSRAVAIKRLHPQFASDPEFVSMFVDEARLVSRIRHPNVVPTLDVVSENGELFMVMDYVQGESLARLLTAMRQRNELVSPAIVAGILGDVLRGLHAAHEATHSKRGPLGIVHRDISPQNVMVGIDGVARILDFGVAKAFHRSHVTREGELKGKIPYMSPEQLRGAEVTRQTDVFAAAILMWESLTTRRLFSAENEERIVDKILNGPVVSPSVFLAESQQALDPRSLRAVRKLDAVVLRGLSRNQSERFATARQMASALEKASDAAPPSVIGDWVERVAQDALRERAARVAELEPDSPPLTVGGMINALQRVAPEALPQRERSRSGSRSRRRKRIPTYAIALVAVSLATVVGVLVVVAAYLVHR